MSHWFFLRVQTRKAAAKPVDMQEFDTFVSYPSLHTPEPSAPPIDTKVEGVGPGGLDARENAAVETPHSQELKVHYGRPVREPSKKKPDCVVQ